MIKRFLSGLCLCWCLFSCGKSELNQGTLNLVLNLNDPAYLVLQGVGNFLVLPDVGIRGLYINRTSDFSFVVYDLVNPNLDPNNGALCVIALGYSAAFLTDFCNMIAYNVLTGQYLPSTIPPTFIGPPNPLYSYHYSFTTDPGREILIIY